MIVDHSDLINTLMTFFTLLYDLTWITDETEILFPDPKTGVLPGYATIPRTAFQASMDAAIAAGVSPAVVDLILRLPQLRDSCHDGTWCLSSTYMKSYHYRPNSDDADQAHWDIDQEIYERPNAVGEDKILPSNMLQLTYSNHYGYVMLYDVDTGLLRAWQPFDGPDSWKDEPALPPSEVFAPWIRNYRNLTWLVEGKSATTWYNGNPDLRLDPPKRHESRYHEMFWKQRVRIWKAKRKLQNVYIECEWNVNAEGPQTKFRRDEFLRRRKEFWKREVEPLVELEGRLSEKMHDQIFPMNGEWESDEEVRQVTEAEEQALLADDLEKSEDEFDEADGEWALSSRDDSEEEDVEDSSSGDYDDDDGQLEEGELEMLEAESVEM